MLGGFILQGADRFKANNWENIVASAIVHVVFEYMRSIGLMEPKENAELEAEFNKLEVGFNNGIGYVTVVFDR